MDEDIIMHAISSLPQNPCMFHAMESY
jgi:hypothetical protein